ncbi:DUF5313 family protein [Nocardia vaccinii]|uniref:DUF5313 family protein n=1 Tax=Nocardia vaccinii TaxID=1822 RepID=UPI00083327CC|nr:DUF5313 family protein [Nocardia vaccinii]
MGGWNDRTTPTLIQRIRYICGGTLPPQMSAWVINDLTGPGAVRRYLLRILIPILVLLCGFLLIPGPLWMRLAMMALLYLPLIYFTAALMYVYRRARLTSHGLDVGFADTGNRQRAAAEREAYERRHGRA